MGSAYRSGRVTCVPEVGVLAWTNRRATPVSLSPPLFLSLSPLLPLSLLIPLAHLHCRARPPTRFFPQLPRFYLDTHRSTRSRHARTSPSSIHVYIPAYLITSADNAMRPFQYNEMADDRGGHIADVGTGRSNDHASRVYSRR